MNPLSNYVVSLIRTYVPILVGGAISWLSLKGVEVNDDVRLATIIALTGMATAAYYTVARTIETKWPALGRFLLGSKTAPVYIMNHQDYTVTENDGSIRAVPNNGE